MIFIHLLDPQRRKVFQALLSIKFDLGGDRFLIEVTRKVLAEGAHNHSTSHAAKDIMV